MVFEHYKKGDRYRFMGHAVEEATGRTVVIYQALRENPMNQVWDWHPRGTVFTRPVEEFFGTVEVDGQTLLRFKYVDA